MAPSCIWWVFACLSNSLGLGSPRNFAFHQGISSTTARLWSSWECITAFLCRQLQTDSAPPINKIRIPGFKAFCFCLCCTHAVSLMTLFLPHWHPLFTSSAPIPLCLPWPLHLSSALHVGHPSHVLCRVAPTSPAHLDMFFFSPVVVSAELTN